MFVHDLIFQIYIFPNFGFGKKHTVFDDSAFFDDTSRRNHGILNSTLNETAVADDRTFHIGSVEILGWAGVVRFCVDLRRSSFEEALYIFEIHQSEVGIEITLQISDGRKISAMWNSPYIQLIAFYVDDLRKCVHGGKFLCFIYKFDEQFTFHHISIHENRAVFGSSAVLLDGKDSFLLVQVQNTHSSKMPLLHCPRNDTSADVCAGFDVGLDHIVEILRV